MKFSYNWLKDFVELKISPEALAEKLTMAGLEVGSLEEKTGDFVFEIEVTSNRPDWLSIVGIAREAAAITGRTLKLPRLMSAKRAKFPNLKATQKFKIIIEDKKDCPLYTAKIISGVNIGPSPDWLKKRLELLGCRSINNVVDITNYILFEWGQPLHAFDLDRLNSDTIMVRRAASHEKIFTIDAQEKTLSPEILVIADYEKPVALAGVMGGKDTEVNEGTKNILLEAAVFNPAVVRRGRQKLGIQSEASYRFERGVALEDLEKISLLAAGLIQEVCGGEFILAKNSGLALAKQVNINLNTLEVDRMLGVSIGSPKIKSILSHLGFKVRAGAKNNFLIGVPAYRQDVKQAVDLVEEISRIFGYDRIPKSLPAVVPQIAAIGTQELAALVKNTLVGLGSQEVITHSLIAQELLKGFAPENGEGVGILNPLSKEQGILRPTLLPSLVKCVAHNLNQKEDYVNIFEIAKVFSKVEGPGPKETLVLGLALCGTKSLLFEQGLVKDEAGFLHLKGTLEVVFQRLGIRDYAFMMEASAGRVSILVGQVRIGQIKSLTPNLLAELEIKNKAVIAAELSLDQLFSSANLKKSFKKLPVYPGISRDISFVLKEEISAAQILSAVKEKGAPLLREVKIADYYKGKQIPSGYKGLTISCLYRSEERTLTEEEISPLHNEISSALVEKLGVKIR